MVISRREKKLQRVLDSLKEKAEPSKVHWNIDKTKYVKPNKKVRRHSGRVFPQLFAPQRKIEEEEIFVDYNYNDWKNYRDGMRDIIHDKTKFIPFKKDNGWYNLSKEEIIKRNNKLKKEREIRKARKFVTN